VDAAAPAFAVTVLPLGVVVGSEAAGVDGRGDGLLLRGSGRDFLAGAERDAAGSFGGGELGTSFNCG
jgi:hypothetical protein